MSVKPIPTGYHTVTPYLIVKGASEAIDFYTKALGAKELYRMACPAGKVMHAEVQVGDSRVMLSDENLEWGARGPETLGGSPVTIHLYVEDVDSLYNQAVAAGAKPTRPVQDMFYGDRAGGFEDPFGHVWHVATHKEDVPPEDMHKRFEEAMMAMGKA